MQARVHHYLTSNGPVQLDDSELRYVGFDDDHGLVSRLEETTLVTEPGTIPRFAKYFHNKLDQDNPLYMIESSLNAHAYEAVHRMLDFTKDWLEQQGRRSHHFLDSSHEDTTALYPVPDTRRILAKGEYYTEHVITNDTRRTGRMGDFA